MLKVRIIPCLDIKDGKVVKGENFKNLKIAGDPVELAKFYNDQMADELCFLDITASSENHSIIYKIIEQVAKCSFIPLIVGGGIKNVSDIKNLLRSGADKVSINSAAIYNPDFVREAAIEFGSQCIVVAIDAKKNDQGNYEIFTHGGSKSTGIDAISWARKMRDYGAGELLVTSMDRDGTKSGFDNKLNALISEATNLPLIASGGVGKIEDFLDGIIEGKADGLLAASVFHYGELQIKQVKQFLSDHDIQVRFEDR